MLLLETIQIFIRVRNFLSSNQEQKEKGTPRHIGRRCVVVILLGFELVKTYNKVYLYY